MTSRLSKNKSLCYKVVVKNESGADCATRVRKRDGRAKYRGNMCLHEFSCKPRTFQYIGARHNEVPVSNYPLVACCFVPNIAMSNGRGDLWPNTISVSDLQLLGVGVPSNPAKRRDLLSHDRILLYPQAACSLQTFANDVQPKGGRLSAAYKSIGYVYVIRHPQIR